MKIQFLTHLKAKVSSKLTENIKGVCSLRNVAVATAVAGISICKVSCDFPNHRIEKVTPPTIERPIFKPYDGGPLSLPVGETT